MVRQIQSRVERNGAAAVELAVLMPPILILLMGIWEVGRMVEIQQILANAAREGARQAATGQLTNAQVQTVVQNYLTVAGVPTTHLNMTGSGGPQMVTDLTNPSYDVSAATYLDQIQVVVQIPFSDVRWSVLSLITTSSTTLTSTVTFYSMVDKGYPSPPEPPAG
jgi:Flp pilus assembly protein TadG